MSARRTFATNLSMLSAEGVGAVDLPLPNQPVDSLVSLMRLVSLSFNIAIVFKELVIHTILGAILYAKLSNSYNLTCNQHLDITTHGQARGPQRRRS